MRLDIWSDVVCPWCYVGKARFEKALSDFPHRDEVEVVYRSFELDPDWPKDLRETALTMLSRKYRMPEEQVAASAGLDSGAVTEVLDSEAYADAVRQDEREARELGITGVPFFVFDMALGVSGAQPADTFTSALDQAWARRG